MSANPAAHNQPSAAPPRTARTPWCTTISSQGSAAYPMRAGSSAP